VDRVASGGVDYDRLAFLTLTTETGLVGDVIQDVLTSPAEKAARLQGEHGFVEWKVNAAPGQDMVASSAQGAKPEEIMIKKTRADDFLAEIDHLADIMAGKVQFSPISLERGLDTMMVIAAAFKSQELGRRVRIDWARGYVPGAVI
jgi:predicted dehydrogenase